MNLEEIKSTWEMYDKKIQSTQLIQEKIIEHMIKERSGSRISGIKRQSYTFFIILTAELIALSGVIFGNPFDFKYAWQYIPYYLLTIGVIMAFLNLLKMLRKINQTWSHLNIDSFLMNILDTYEKNKVFEKWFGSVFLLMGIIIPISFLPNKIERKGLFAALSEVALMMLMTAIFYAIAIKFGAFKNHHKENFQKDLKDLNEMKKFMEDTSSSN